MESPAATDSESRPTVTFWEAFRFWLKLGFISFGGPAGRFPSCTRSWWNDVAGFLSAGFCTR